MAALFESIPKEVAQQISNREKLHAAAARSKDILVYQNSNGPWIRLRSSVNIVGDDEAKSYADNGGPSPPSGAGPLRPAPRSPAAAAALKWIARAR